MEGPLAPTLQEIAELAGGRVVGGEATFRVKGIRSLEEATEEEISVYSDSRYKPLLAETRAGALIVGEETDLFNGPQVVVGHPGLACARVAGIFAQPASAFQGIHEGAFLHETCRIGKDVTVFPFVYVGADTVIEDHVTLFPGVFVGDRVRIGRGTMIHPNVSVLHDCTVGRDVIIHAGAVIGSDGFGFVREGARNVKMPQIGKVQIDDSVEIGAGNTIDRATLGTTRIHRGVKTDNLVQIAHNVVIGEDTVIVAQSAIAGSAEIGKGVIIGGQVAVSDHVKVGDGAMIGSQSGVPKSLGPGEVVSGTPAMPHRLWLKTSLLLPRLSEVNDRLRTLEKKVDELARRLDTEP
jgi:UDP-3-O-[3-hydroxymyristoyl] glucosamine N-acyltransferase